MTRRAAELARLPGGDWTLSLVFLGDPAMARANREILEHEGTTDVITMSYLDDPESCFDGEVALEALIAPEVAQREGARRRNSSYAREMVLYIVHALLHAAGEDDLEPEPRRRMRRREREVMRRLEGDFDFAAIFPDSENLT